jgi:UDP-3-O-[3-hydroxymyristoyl] glucosamine N-acyltransferase
VVRPDGDFTVFWTGKLPWAPHRGDVYGVLGQHFKGQGRRGEAFRVGYHPGDSSESAALGKDGTLVVAWSRLLEDHSGTYNIPGGVFASRFRFGADAGRGDSDKDGVADSSDNCPTVANPGQTDVNNDGYGDDCVAPDVLIPPTAQIGANPVIGSGTSIAPGVVIGDHAIIGENVTIDLQVRAGDRLRVEDGVFLGQRSTLANRVTIGAATRLDGPASIGNGVTIGDHAVLGRNASAAGRATIGPLVSVGIGARVGRNATVEMGASLGRGAVVSPGAVVPAGVVVPPGATYP